MIGIGGGGIIRPMLGFLDVVKGLASFTSSEYVLFIAISNLLSKERNTFSKNTVKYSDKKVLEK
jgi:uncharacterized membrane protein YfcA